MITPGQFEVPGSTPITDPLQLQFMTQGQMGYMPQAQFLTPYQYGNFRTLPTPDVAGYAAQETGFIQNALTAYRGSDPFGILPAYMVNTYNPAINARQQQVVAQRRMEDSRAMIAPLATDMLLGVGMSVAGGIPGLIASMIMPDWMSPSEAVAQRRKSTREIQNLSSSKIFTGSAKDEAYGLGFGFHQARDIDRFIRERAADDTIMKEGDWRDILSLGMKYGQFDYANNAEQYKRILKNMRGNMTTMMEVIGSTDFEEIMRNMKRMQDMGAKQEHYMNIARKEQQYARVTGLSHQELVDTYGQAGALTFQQAGLNAMQGSVTAMGNAALATYLQRTGAIDPTLMAHFGGVSGMAQQMTQASAKAHRNIQDTLLAGMMNDDFTGLAEGLDLADIVNDPRGMDKLLAGAGRANTIGKQRRFNVNRHKAYAELQEKYGPEVLEALMAKMAGQRLTGSDGDDALFYGYQSLGYSSEEAEARLAMVKSGGIWEMAKQAKEEQRRKSKEEREQRNSPLAKLGRWFEGMKNTFGEWAYSKLTPSSLPSQINAQAATDAGQTYQANAGTSSGGGAGSFNNLLLEGGAGSTGAVPAGKLSEGKNRFYWEHNNDLDAIALLFEPEDPYHPMRDITKDSKGYSYGAYQTNTAEGSQQEWLTQMWNDKDARGKGIVERILRASGINDEVNSGNVRSLLNKVDWSKGGAAAKQYLVEAEANADYMKNSQLQYIMPRYEGALKDLGKVNPELEKLVRSDRELQQLLFAVTVQHGPGSVGSKAGAVSVFKEFYHNGMTAEELTNAIEGSRWMRFSGNDRVSMRNNRTPLERDILNASRRIRQGGGIAGSQAGIVPANENVVVPGLENIGEESARAQAARAVAVYSRNREAAGVKYALGVKNSIVANSRDHNGVAHAGLNIDCSGLGMEELEYIVANSKDLNGGVDVYDPAKIQAIRNQNAQEGASGIIRAAAIAAGKEYVGSEFNKDLVRQRGTMLVGIRAGHGDDYRYHGIDHYMTAYVDPETGEVRFSDSSSSGHGVRDRSWDEVMHDWKEAGVHVKGIRAVALEDLQVNKGNGNVVKSGTYGVGVDKRKKQVHGEAAMPVKTAAAKGMAPPGEQIPGVEQSYRGETQDVIDQDQMDARRRAESLIAKQLAETENAGYLGDLGMTREQIYNLYNEVGTGLLEKEEYEKREKIEEDYYNERLAEEQRKAGVREGDIKTLSSDVMRSSVRNNGEDLTSSRDALSGRITKDLLKNDKEPVTFENVDIYKLSKVNPLFNIHLENVEKTGRTGEQAQRMAFNLLMDPKANAYARMFAVHENIGSNVGQAVDDVKLSYDRVNSSSNYEDAARLSDVYKETAETAFGGDMTDEQRAIFDRTYKDIIGDATREAGKKFTRGAYAEKIPKLAEYLGHLSAVEAELKNAGPATPKDKIRKLEERKQEIIVNIIDLLRAYGIPHDIITRILSEHTDVHTRLNEISTEMGRVEDGKGWTLSQKQLNAAEELTLASQKKFADIYGDSVLGNGRYYELEGEEGSFVQRLRDMDASDYDKAGANLAADRGNSKLMGRLRSNEVESYQNTYDIMQAQKLWSNRSGLTWEQMNNLPGLDDATINAAVARLIANGEEERAKDLLEFRKQGKNLTIDRYNQILYDKNGNRQKAENAEDEISQQMNGYDKAKGTITKGMSDGGGVMGQGPGISGNSNLDGLPVTMDHLDKTMTRVEVLLDNINRRLGGPEVPKEQ